MLGMEAPHRHDLAWLCRNLERRTISLICNQPFHIWDCGYVMRVTHHCTLTALLPKRSQGKLTKSWVFNHFNKAFSVLRLFTWRSLITGDGNMCDPTMAPMQGIQAPSTLTSSKNREGAGGGFGGRQLSNTKWHQSLGCWVFMLTGSCSLHYDPWTSHLKQIIIVCAQESQWFHPVGFHCN